MRIRFFFIIIFLLISSKANLTYCQSVPKVFHMNTVRLDCSTLIIINSYSVNYERTVFYREFFKTNFNIGYGGLGLLEGDNYNTYWCLPVSMNILVGRISHLELNYGDVIIEPFGKRLRDNYECLGIGYRYQDFQDNEIFRIFIGYSGFGIGYGISF